MNLYVDIVRYGNTIQWKICYHDNLPHTEKLYERQPTQLLEGENVIVALELPYIY